MTRGWINQNFLFIFASSLQIHGQKCTADTQLYRHKTLYLFSHTQCPLCIYIYAIHSSNYKSIFFSFWCPRFAHYFFLGQTSIYALRMLLFPLVCIKNIWTFSSTRSEISAVTMNMQVIQNVWKNKISSFSVFPRQQCN